MRYTATELDAFIRRRAPQLARSVQIAAHSAANEAEFRSRVTRHIEDMARELEVSLVAREEYTLASGRADAVYNRLVIEYEAPGSLRPDLRHSATRHAVDQLRRYIEDIARQEGHQADRLLGVALDGHYYVFARYRAGHWLVEPPLEVTTASTVRFLRGLFSLASGRALIPENLVEDFGAQSRVGQEVTRALYHALAGHEDDLVGRLFHQWQLFFSEVSGYEEARVRLRDKRELRRFAQGMGVDPETADPPRLFFAIHTYFSFLVKAIARLVLERHAGGRLSTTPLTCVAGMDDAALHRELRDLEEGGIFRALGLMNLLEGDFFRWYLHTWSSELAEVLRQTLTRLGEYNPVTIEEDPFAARDLLKKLYHYLLPRELRHDLGEYYTPDWLAERVLHQLNEPLFVMPDPTSPPQRLDFDRRLLDPACGSGTFLVLAIRALKEHCLRAGWGEAETLELILRNVVGIDLNPLAVLAARVNYLLTIADLVPYRRRPIEIPVYLADSILMPTVGQGLFEQGRRILKTAVGDLAVPSSVNTRESMERLATLLEEYVRGGFSTGAFLERAQRELNLEPGSLDESILQELYETMRDLEARGLNGIWARILKNAFMPLFLGRFDYVAGNPPWVNWESLPDGYRAETAYLWQEYGLFVHSGMDAILGKGKKDISTLMTYVAADRYLKEGGKLAFVITQSVFKTAGAGQGFRRFHIGQDGPPLRVLHVDDMSELQPFEGASNRTAVVVLQKGQPTRYPVPYTFWKKTKRGRLGYESTLEEVMALTWRLNFAAEPVSDDDPTSAWLTARPRALQAIHKVLGPSDYEAHEGVNTGGANAVYWVEIVDERPDGLVVVRNITKGAKRRVEPVVAPLEPDLLYPLLRGRDVQRWRAAPSAYVLMVQDPQKRRGIDEKELQRRWPYIWAYLKRFEKVLRERAAFRRYFTRKDRSGRTVETGPFYSMFNVGQYTLAPYKVVWRYIASEMTAAAVTETNGKVIVADHRLIMVSTEVPEEAFYLAGILNSAIGRFAVGAYIVETQISTHVLKKICIPRYDPANPLHRRLVALSRRAHELATVEDAEALAAVEREIDEAAAEMWGISAEELEEIRRSLAEMS